MPPERVAAFDSCWPTNDRQRCVPCSTLIDQGNRMEFVCNTAEKIPQALYRSLAGYRHQVFVERLGWELPSQPGYEQDQFDRADTVHVVARNASGDIVGCGRLLPTS